MNKNSFLLESGGIKFQQDKKKHGKRPKRRSPVTDKRQRNTDYRSQTNCHADIYSKVKEKYRQYAVTKNSSKRFTLPISYQHYAE